MENKPYLKSKTIDSLIVLAIIVILNIIGIGEAEPGKTYDTMLDMEGRRGEQIKNILMLVGIGGAGYGRIKADTNLGKKKD